MNPLLVSLAESRHLGHDQEFALLKLMMLIRDSGEVRPAIALTLSWVHERGMPTWDSMTAWASDYAADPANADVMQDLRDRHDEVLRAMTAEERRDIEAFLLGT